MVKIALGLVCALALLAPAPSALAQQALSADGEFRVTVADTSGVVMVQSSPPVTTPTSPVLIWVWNFYPTVQGEAPEAFMSTATHTRVDCTAMTLELIYQERYLFELHTSSSEMDVLSWPEANTIGALTLSAACEPGWFPESSITLPDYRTADAVVRNAFANQAQ